MQIGRTQILTVLERNRDSLLLDGGDGHTVALPLNEAASAAPGDELQVFIHTDTAGNPQATTRTPLVERDSCASLQVVDITNAGAFLDWGLAKNLLLPYAEQRRPLEIGRHESVLVYLDKSGRLAASSRLDHHLPETVEDFRPWQPVNLLIFQRTDLGLKAVVDDRAIGLLYKDEIFQNIRVGESHRGYIKRLRHDGRIDLSLQPRNRELQPELTDAILSRLQAEGGRCELSDKSSPEAIQAAFQVSKKNFKKALSTLYKERRIVIHPGHIELAQTDTPADTAPPPDKAAGSARGGRSGPDGRDERDEPDKARKAQPSDTARRKRPNKDRRG